MSTATSGASNVVEAALLPETFIHIAGIGPKTELRLWQSGVSSWAALAETPLGLRPPIAETLERSAEALATKDLSFFFQALPSRERWRSFADYGSRFVALDIETTGMSSYYDEITLIGTEVDGEYRTFLRGSNLEEARDLIAEADGLITFNGALFDLPFIQRTFPGLAMPSAHVDLRFLARRVGLAGSLKHVEQEAELARDEELDDISGYYATVLWSEFEYAGQVEALEQLILYNAADTCVLRPLAELVVDRLRDELDELRDVQTEDELPFEADPVPSRKRRNVSRRVPKAPMIKSDLATLRVGRHQFDLPERRVEPAVTLAALRSRMRDPASRVVGIDLTGSAARPTGWALLQDDLVVTGTLGSTEEIVDRTLRVEPRLVSIDSPLSLPDGRDCTDDACPCRAIGGITRHCERELKRRGVNVYPSLIQSMQALTSRGIEIANRLRAAGVEVIESYPGAAQDIMRIPRKRASLEWLQVGLERFGMRGLRAVGDVTHDELDAATSAAVGSFYLADLYEALGNEAEEYLIVPSLEGFGGSSEPCDETPLDRPLFVFAGPGAELAASETGRPRTSSANVAVDEHEAVLVLADLDDYGKVLALAGPRARCAYVGDADGSGRRRRRSFVDHDLNAENDDFDLTLIEWMSDWEAVG